MNFNSSIFVGIQDWGITMDKKDIHLKWHIPTIEELEWAKVIFLRVFNRFSEKYETIDTLTERNEVLEKCFLKDIQILSSAMDAMNSLIPFWDKTPFKS